MLINFHLYWLALSSLIFLSEIFNLVNMVATWIHLIMHIIGNCFNQTCFTHSTSAFYDKAFEFPMILFDIFLKRTGYRCLKIIQKRVWLLNNDVSEIRKWSYPIFNFITKSLSFKALWHISWRIFVAPLWKTIWLKISFNYAFNKVLIQLCFGSHYVNSFF